MVSAWKPLRRFKRIAWVMNHRQIPAPRSIRAPAYREAFERLDAALEKNAPWDNRVKIRLMREAAFADVDALERSGEFKLPEYKP